MINKVKIYKIIRKSIDISKIKNDGDKTEKLVLDNYDYK